MLDLAISLSFGLTLRSPLMLTPVKIPLVAGKKMANIWKKVPLGPLQSGTRLATNILPQHTQHKSLLFSDKTGNIEQSTDLGFRKVCYEHWSLKRILLSLVKYLYQYRCINASKFVLKCLNSLL